MSRRPSPTWWSTLAVCACLVGVLASPVSARNRAAEGPAPAFTLPTRAGGVCLDSLRGSVVYLDFWASWCGPCRASFPWMSTLQTRYAERGLRVVAVNLDKQRELADAFLAGRSTPFTVAFDPAGQIARAYQVAAMPSSFLIGRDGRLIVRHAGFEAGHVAKLEQQIEEALSR